MLSEKGVALHDTSDVCVGLIRNVDDVVRQTVEVFQGVGVGDYDMTFVKREHQKDVGYCSNGVCRHVLRLDVHRTRSGNAVLLVVKEPDERHR